MKMLSEVIKSTIQSISDYGNTEFVKLIVNHLNEARDGIVNLKTTYGNDPNIQAQIEVLLENIDIQLTKNFDHIVINFRTNNVNKIPNNVETIPEVINLIPEVIDNVEIKKTRAELRKELLAGVKPLARIVNTSE